MVAAILLACGALTLVRTNGLTGDAVSDFEWRWTPTAEQRLLARAGDEPLDAARGGPLGTCQPRTRPRIARRISPARRRRLPASSASRGDADDAERRTCRSANRRIRAGVEWPGFRGPERDSVVRGVRIETDWSRTPPVELWRQPIGPGWSSFAVAGDRVFTQEQRGDDEIVSAYNLKTGEPVWRHRDAARFWESNAGAWPARDADTQQRSRLHTRSNGNPERARRP